MDMDIDKLTKDTISGGGVLAFLYFDLHAGNKEVLQQLGATMVQRVLAEPGVVYAVGEIDEPMPNNDLLSTSVEVKVLVKGFDVLVRICGNYSPFSVEVLRPDEVKLSPDKVHDILMNVSVNNYDLKKFIIEKVSNKQDLERHKKALEGRLEVSRKLLEKK
ncbi:Uncharacterised protein [uncultured archaeon]|nr:Uncharacterised protein [uncultured archaeon]